MTESTNITWAVNTLERTTIDDVVSTIHYTVSAEDGIHSTNSYGSVGLEQPDPEALIPYSELTPEQVIDWLKDKLGEETVTNVETSLLQQLEEQRQPSHAQGTPWT